MSRIHCCNPDLGCSKPTSAMSCPRSLKYWTELYLVQHFQIKLLARNQEMSSVFHRSFAACNRISWVGTSFQRKPSSFKAAHERGSWADKRETVSCLVDLTFSCAGQNELPISSHIGYIAIRPLVDKNGDQAFSPHTLE